VKSANFCDRNQGESFCPGPELQIRQFPFQSFSFELRGVSIDPGLAMSRWISTARWRAIAFTAALNVGKLPAQMSIAGPKYVSLSSKEVAAVRSARAAGLTGGRS